MASNELFTAANQQDDSACGKVCKNLNCSAVLSMLSWLKPNACNKEECQSALLLVATVRAATQPFFGPRIIFRLDTTTKTVSLILIPTFGLFRLQLGHTNLSPLLDCNNGTSSFDELGLHAEAPSNPDEDEHDHVLEPGSRAPPESLPSTERWARAEAPSTQTMAA